MDYSMEINMKPCYVFKNTCSIARITDPLIAPREHKLGLQDKVVILLLTAKKKLHA